MRRRTRSNGMIERWQSWVTSPQGEKAADLFCVGILLGGAILFACGVIG